MTARTCGIITGPRAVAVSSSQDSIFGYCSDPGGSMYSAFTGDIAAISSDRATAARSDASSISVVSTSPVFLSLVDPIDTVRSTVKPAVVIPLLAKRTCACSDSAIDTEQCGNFENDRILFASACVCSLVIMATLRLVGQNHVDLPKP